MEVTLERKTVEDALSALIDEIYALEADQRLGGMDRLFYLAEVAAAALRRQESE